MSGPSTRIGIAVVEHDGRYLVGTRSDDGPLAGFAEFPGGKCRPAESPQECACRECREETGLNVLPLRLLLNRPYTYPHGTVDLHFWLCRPLDPHSVSDTHRGYRWIPAHELTSLNFPPANAPLLDQLTDDDRVTH